MRCMQCGSERFSRAGHDGTGRQRFCCKRCRSRQTTRSATAFAGYRFPDDIIALAVRWYLHYRLPYANVAELLAERGVYVDASTVFDWVQRFAPLPGGSSPAAHAGSWQLEHRRVATRSRICSC
jgi:transposase-like protein